MGVICLDNDEVLFELFWPVVAHYNTVDGTSHTRDDIAFDLSSLWDRSLEDTLDRFDTFFREGHAYQLPCVPGAQEAVAEISKYHFLSVVTLRPESYREVTQHMLSTHYDDSIHSLHHVTREPGTFMREKKSEVCTQLGADLLVEDSLVHAKECASAGVPVYLFDCPWNQSDEDLSCYGAGITRVYGWEHVLEKLNAQMVS